jgi:hypothetical protein
MKRITIAAMFFVSLVGCAASLDGFSSVEMRPGEAAFEQLFNQGIGQAWIGGNPPWAHGEDRAISGAFSAKSKRVSSLYSQYFQTTAGAAPSEHITTPKQFELAGNTPTTVFFSAQMQAVPYPQYQTSAIYANGNSLWIKGSTNWTQYAQVPQGAILSLISIASTAGSGYLYEIYPNGNLTKESFTFYPYNQMSIHADTVGQHILLFAIGNQVSNAVVMDVMGIKEWQRPSYQPLTWPPGHSPFAY